MRISLLRAFLLVALCWWGGSTLWWALASPQQNLATLQALADLLPWLPLNVPEAPVSVLDAWSLQRQVLLYWTLPLLGLSTLTGLAGYAVVWLLTWRQQQQRTWRESGRGQYRGMRVTLGEVPTPQVLSYDVLQLGSDAQGQLDRLTVPQRQLLQQVLGVLSRAAHPLALPPAPTLLEQSLHAAAGALDQPDQPGLRALVTAALPLGALTAYREFPDRGWMQTRDLGREAAKALVRLPGWWGLPPEERVAVALAVKYQNARSELPTLGNLPAATTLAQQLLTAPAVPPPAAVAATATVATATSSPALSATSAPVSPPPLAPAFAAAVVPEPAPVVEVTADNLPDVLVDVFVRCLPMVPFQRPGQPKAVPAAGWNKGNRVYLLEGRLREVLAAKLPPAVSTLLKLDQDKVARQKPHPLTVALLQAFHDRGWLVREIDKLKLDVKEALWNVKAGTLPFTGVLIVDLPEEHCPLLPSSDSHYDVTVTGASVRQPGSYQTNRMDLSDMLRPSTRPAEPKASSDSTAPVGSSAAGPTSATT